MVPSGSIAVAGTPSFLSVPKIALHHSGQFACGHRHLGKPLDYQTLSTTRPFEEMACSLCRSVRQHPTPQFAKSSKLSTTASSPSIPLNQTKRRPLLNVASYHQVPNGTRTGASCLIGCSDPTRLNKKCTMQPLALCCRGYWTDSIQRCLRTG